jgi:hypothetical protein
MKVASERDEGGDVLRGLLAAQGDAYEAFDRADVLLDAGSALIEVLGKNFGLAAAFWRYAMAGQLPCQRVDRSEIIWF